MCSSFEGLPRTIQHTIYQFLAFNEKFQTLPALCKEIASAFHQSKDQSISFRYDSIDIEILSTEQLQQLRAQSNFGYDSPKYHYERSSINFQGREAPISRIPYVRHVTFTQSLNVPIDPVERDQLIDLLMKSLSAPNMASLFIEEQTINETSLITRLDVSLLSNSDQSNDQSSTSDNQSDMSENKSSGPSNRSSCQSVIPFQLGLKCYEIDQSMDLSKLLFNQSINRSLGRSTKRSVTSLQLSFLTAEITSVDWIRSANQSVDGSIWQSINRTIKHLELSGRFITQQTVLNIFRSLGQTTNQSSKQSNTQPLLPRLLSLKLEVV